MPGVIQVSGKKTGSNARVREQVREKVGIPVHLPLPIRLIIECTVNRELELRYEF